MIETCTERIRIALPTSPSFTFSWEVDPEVKGSLLIVAKPTARHYEPAFSIFTQFVQIFPDRARRLGLAVRSDGF